MSNWEKHNKRVREQWLSPFCGCCDDWSSCCLTCFVPCVQYGYNAQKIDGSSFCGACCMYWCCMFMGYQGCIAGGKRTSMRNNYNLEESCCCDCCVHWCCYLCAITQETRELELRGPPPEKQSMTPMNIIVNNSTNMPAQQSPGGGMVMMNVNGSMQPVPQGGQWMVGPNGQMMMYPPQGTVMQAPMAGQQPAYYATNGQPDNTVHPPQYAAPAQTSPHSPNHQYTYTSTDTNTEGVAKPTKTVD